MTKLGKRPRIGVIGGTFDPIHNGHLHIARELQRELSLDRIIWVPAGRPPHKTGQIVSSDFDRLRMLKLAVADDPGAAINTVDIDRIGPSYTADMLEMLAAESAPAELIFLMGEDSLRDFPTWRDPERILRAAELGVAGRPGVDTDLDALEAMIPGLRGRVYIVPTREVLLSSSEIRNRVRQGKTIFGLVPPSVERYIFAQGLYAPVPEAARRDQDG